MRRSDKTLGTFGIGLALWATSSAMAQTPSATEAFMKSKPFAAAKDKLAADYDRTLADVITLTEIPSPPFKEAVRAEAYKKMLAAHGLSDIAMDAEGNVMGLRKGTGGGGLLVVAAHMDTVFPEGTDVKVRSDGDKLYAPGIGDDTASLSVILAIIRALDTANIKTRGDILFVGNVGEEGPGDLRGVKYLFQKGKYAGKITHFMSIEPGATGSFYTGGIGSKRYEVTFRGPGGHSWIHFGMVNPAYAVADSIIGLGKYDAPKDPRTSYNIGLISGGTSVNTIPSQMSLTVDMRSETAAELAKIDAYFLEQLKAANDAENARHSTARGSLTYEAKVVGERPTGLTPSDSPIVLIATAARKASGETVSYGKGSTDSNLPMSLNIPAITIGSGFASDGAHSPQEYITLNKAQTIKIMAADLATIVSIANILAKAK
jgi:tripeptide aminopeptidase